MGWPPGLSGIGSSPALFLVKAGCHSALSTTSTINAGGQADSANQISPVVQIYGGHDSNHPYFNGAAFANPPNNVLGSTGHYLGGVFGPGLFQMNATISRIFPFKEGKINFQLQGEAYNLTNTVVFSNPGGQLLLDSRRERCHQLQRLRRDLRNPIHAKVFGGGRISPLLTLHDAKSVTKRALRHSDKR